MENKFTDNEIIKALECCIYGRSVCKNCHYNYSDDCQRTMMIDVLDIIKRLKAENKEFDEKIVIQSGTIDWQAKEINRQKAEIERLKWDLAFREKQLDNLAKEIAG